MGDGIINSAPTMRSFFWILAAICAIGLVIRAAILTDYIRTNPLASVLINDSQVYWDWAGDIAEGRGRSDAPFLSSPLYPYLLGALRWMGGSLAAVYLFQSLSNLATACILAVVGRNRFGPVVGLLAAGLFLLLQEPASAALRILPTSLHFFLIAATWACLVRAHVRPSLGRTLLVGVCLGFLSLAYSLAYSPAAILVIPAVAWLCWGAGRLPARVLHAATAAAAAAVVIAPATLHNWRAAQEFFLIQSGGGVTLRQGNCRESTGVYTPIPGVSTQRSLMHSDAARVYHEATGKPPTWKAVDNYYRDQAFREWRSDPPWAVNLAMRKLYMFLTACHYADIYQTAAEIAAGVNRRLLLTPLPTPWLIGPAVIGLILLLRSPLRHAPEWSLFLLPLLVVVVFWYSPRYRAPALPMIVVAAAFAAQAAFSGRRRLGRASAVLASLLLFASLPLVNQRLGLDLVDPTNASFNLGYALHREGKLQAAAEKFREGLRYKPGEKSMRIILGDILLDLGQIDQALIEYQHVQKQSPADAEILGRLANARLRNREISEARMLLMQALDLQPDQPSLIGLLARIEGSEGRLDQALELYSKSLRLAPDDVGTRAAYADLLERLGRLEEAKREFITVVLASPGDYEAIHRLGIACGRLGDLTQARAYLEQSLRIRADNAPVWHDLGVLYSSENLLDEAIRCFRKALQIDPACRPCMEALHHLGQTSPSAPPDGR